MERDALQSHYFLRNKVIYNKSGSDNLKFRNILDVKYLGKSLNNVSLYHFKDIFDGFDASEYYYYEKPVIRSKYLVRLYHDEEVSDPYSTNAKVNLITIVNADVIYRTIYGFLDLLVDLFKFLK